MTVETSRGFVPEFTRGDRMRVALRHAGETGKAPTFPSGPEGWYTSRDSNPEPADYESGVVVDLDAYRRAAASTSEVAA